MNNLITRFLLYWNQPIHEPTAEDIAEIQATEELIARLQATERETGKSIIYDLPDTYCIL